MTVKHRDTLFAVIRVLKGYNSCPVKTLVAVTSSLDRAEELCGVYLQEWKDKYTSDVPWELKFVVEPVTYYDE